MVVGVKVSCEDQRRVILDVEEVVFVSCERREVDDASCSWLCVGGEMDRVFWKILGFISLAR